MDVQHFQEGVGTTGIFGEVIMGLGLVVAAMGLTYIVLWATDVFVPEDPAGMVALGALMILVGVGFSVVGIIALQEGWARHHDPPPPH